MKYKLGENEKIGPTWYEVILIAMIGLGVGLLLFAKALPYINELYVRYMPQNDPILYKVQVDAKKQAEGALNGSDVANALREGHLKLYGGETASQVVPSKSYVYEDGTIDYQPAYKPDGQRF